MADTSCPSPPVTLTNEPPAQSTTAQSALLPRPDRSLGWIVLNALWGTWFLIAVHVGALAVFLTGTTWQDWVLFPLMMLFRGYVTTIGYHRYFSHRAFKTSRPVQFLLACACCLNLQRGPLWWAAIHRHHHRHSDDDHDAHSPVRGSIFWSHCGWMFSTLEEPNWDSVRDLRRFPELVWLERFWLLPPLLLAAVMYLVGGWSMVCLDFCLTAAIAMQAAFTVNSLGHLIGWQRYQTNDSSRNSFLMGFVTLGDGWHNNHHHYPHSANHGFFRGEVDSSYNLIRLMAWLGLIWDVRKAPPHKVAAVAARPSAAAIAPATEGRLQTDS
jgi:stearoyl-CoA desaturase (delta-9 desaturase)